MRDGKLIPQFREKVVEVPVSQSIPVANGEPEVDIDIPIPEVRVPIREFIPTKKEKVPETTRTPADDFLVFIIESNNYCRVAS